MNSAQTNTPGKPLGRRRLCVSTIVEWARLHRLRKGQWPTTESGPIPESRGDTWGSIDAALAMGGRGLPGGSCLIELLQGYRFNPLNSQAIRRFRLTESRILAWAEEHRQRTGRLPHQHAGVIGDASGLTWMKVNVALERGGLGLPGGTSLAKLLRKRRGTIRRVNKPPWSVRLILQWADAHYERTGKWPTFRSGPIDDAPGVQWRAVGSALIMGRRGFRGGTTLGQLLVKHRGITLQQFRRSPLTPSLILRWADEHHDRTGEWPNSKSGAIPGTDGETWDTVALAIFTGGRGLSKSSLPILLAEHRGVRNFRHLPDLSHKQILQWADDHFNRCGKWPNSKSGPIRDGGGDTWKSVATAMHRGGRGLPDGTSLGVLLQRERGVEPNLPIGRGARERILAKAELS